MKAATTATTTAAKPAPKSETVAVAARSEPEKPAAVIKKDTEVAPTPPQKVISYDLCLNCGKIPRRLSFRDRRQIRFNTCMFVYLSMDF